MPDNINEKISPNEDVQKIPAVEETSSETAAPEYGAVVIRLKHGTN